MLKLGATHSDLTRRAEIDQPHTSNGNVVMEAELSDSKAKDIFSPELCFKIPKDFWRH